MNRVFETQEKVQERKLSNFKAKEFLRDDPMREIVQNDCSEFQNDGFGQILPPLVPLIQQTSSSDSQGEDPFDTIQSSLLNKV